MDQEEQLPIKKIFEIIGDPGDVKDKIYPSRIIVQVSVQSLTLSQLEQISMVPRFRSMDISLQTGIVRMEIYRSNVRQKRLRDENHKGCSHVFEFECDREDKRLINKILSSFANMQGDLTMFDVHVLKGEDGYEISITSLDDVEWRYISKVFDSYNAFIKNVVFDFSGAKLRFVLENVLPKTKV